MKKVALVGTIDTKAAQYGFLADCLEAQGLSPLIINTGLFESPVLQSHIPASEVALAGGKPLDELVSAWENRTLSFEVMGEGASRIVENLCCEGVIHGVIALGGGQGTLLGAMVMGRLPTGFPKVLVSTLANIRIPPFAGIRDTLVINSVVDIEGENSVLRDVLRNAANALAGMVLHSGPKAASGRPKIAATMLGVTTPCVSRMRSILERLGYEVLVFHANGTGGRVMEQMILEGQIQAVADITTVEIGHLVVGGNGSAGQERLEAAGKMGIPQVVSLGALDLINFMPPESVPPCFVGRKFHMHNPNLKVMRVDADESRLIARALAEKLNRSTGPVTVVLPLGGLSANDRTGGIFYAPEADRALFGELRAHLSPSVKIVESLCHINDAQFSSLLAECVAGLLEPDCNKPSADI